MLMVWSLMELRFDGTQQGRNLGLLEGGAMPNQAQFNYCYVSYIINPIYCALIYPYQTLCSMHVTSFRTLFSRRLDPNQNKRSELFLYGLS